MFPCCGLPCFPRKESRENKEGFLWRAEKKKVQGSEYSEGEPAVWSCVGSVCLLRYIP
jgi:hypothetical protein